MTSVQFPTWALSSKAVVHGHCLVTLPFTLNETLKWHSSLPILMQDSFWWWQCSVRYIFSPPPSFWDFSPHQDLSGDNSVLNKSNKWSQFSSGDYSVLNGWLVTGFFNILSTAQGHLRTIKLCHKQTHISKLFSENKPFPFDSQINKINP